GGEADRADGRRPPEPEPGQVAPSACACERQEASPRPAATLPQLVYALGRLGFDFLTEAPPDSVIQNIKPPASGVQPNPFDVGQLLSYLEANPWDAASLTWTLNLDATPIYAIMPMGPFADEAHRRLRQFLGDQEREGVERISVPGIL